MPLEGLGRRGGMELLIKELKEKEKVVNVRLKKITDVKNPSAAHLEEKVNQEMTKKEIEKEIEQAQWWTYHILDQGKIW